MKQGSNWGGKGLNRPPQPILVKIWTPTDAVIWSTPFLTIRTLHWKWLVKMFCCFSSCWWNSDVLASSRLIIWSRASGVSWLSRSRRFLVSFSPSSRLVSHLVLVSFSFSSHSRLVLVSFSSRSCSPLVLVLFSSRLASFSFVIVLVLVSFASRVLDSFSSHSRLILISFSSRSHLVHVSFSSRPLSYSIILRHSIHTWSRDVRVILWIVHEPHHLPNPHLRDLADQLALTMTQNKYLEINISKLYRSHMYSEQLNQTLQSPEVTYFSGLIRRFIFDHFSVSGVV